MRANNNLRTWLWPMVMAIALFIAVGSLWQSLSQPAAAQTDDGEPPTAERIIHVTGRGQVSAAPDMAVVLLGVQTEAETAADALSANSEQMQTVISATVEAGIAEEDLRTTGLRLQPRYERPDPETEPEGPPEIVGYQAANQVEITVRELDGLGDLLDAAVAAGANTIESIRFEISDQEALLTEARTAAMEDAIAQAGLLTSLAGAELGPVMTIRTIDGARPVAAQAFAAEESAAAVPVQPGRQTVEVTVQVSWAIE